MHKPLISVIIPVYNVEKYLKFCLDGVLGQTYKNLEIILVDDGSPDNCLQICGEYAQRDSRVLVLQQSNSGQSAARNAALDKATGEYILFIDADDYVSGDHVESLYAALLEHQADISVQPLFSFFNGEEEHIKPDSSGGNENSRCMPAEKALASMLYQRGFDIGPCGKLFSAASFSGVRFPEGRIYEDLAVICQPFTKAEKVAYSKHSTYGYRLHNQGTVGTAFSEKKMDVVAGAKNMYETIEQNAPKLKKAAKCRYFSAIMNVYLTIEKDKFPAQEELLWQEAMKYRSTVLRDIKSRPKAKGAAALSLFGRNALRKVWNRVPSLSSRS